MEPILNATKTHEVGYVMKQKRNLRMTVSTHSKQLLHTIFTIVKFVEIN